MTDGLSRVLYGIPPAEDSNRKASDVQVLAYTENLDPQTAASWRALSAVDPISRSGIESTQTVGIFAGPEQAFILAHAQLLDENSPYYLYTLLPRNILRLQKGNLLELAHVVQPSRGTTQLTPMSLPTPKEWSLEQRSAIVEQLITQTGDITHVLSLLSAALDERRLMIRNFTGGLDDRLQTVMGLMALLPTYVRADLTFSTYISNSAQAATARIIFSDDNSTNRVTVDWQATSESADTTSWPAYVSQLAATWNSDVPALLQAVETYDPLVARLPEDENLIAHLNALTQRFSFNNQVDQDADVDPAALKDALEHAEDYPPAWRRRYATLLLPHALEARDKDTHSLIAGQMDEDPELDKTLYASLRDVLETTPDLVYVFVRQRLSEQITPRWLDRLKEAASRALSVAIATEDPDTIINWLRLIAREPSRFELEPMLHQGIHDVQALTHTNGEFGQRLLVLTARYTPALLDELLDDDALLDELPDVFRQALREYNPNALAALQARSTTLFLAGMARAAENQHGPAFDEGGIEDIWSLYTDEDLSNVPEQYQPEHILTVCTQTGATWLSSQSIETLLTILLAADAEELLTNFLTHLHENDSLLRHLPAALVNSDREPNGILELVATLLSNDMLDAQQTIDLYVTVLEGWEWSEYYLPLMERMVRLLAQDDTLSVQEETLQQIFHVAVAQQDESLAKTSGLLLLNSLESLEDEDAFVSGVQVCFTQLSWSASTKQAILEWWRAFVQEQSTARLGRIDRALEGIRVMEDAQQILRSVLALRKLIGKGDLVQFTEDVNTAYKLLETLAESFEPSEKQPPSFDAETIRLELDLLKEEITPHQRQIIANSLKELAAIIGRMGDNRSRARLTRRGDNLDRQLMTGEQQPQSAVDVMKWIAGYFRGAQDDES